MHVLPIALLCSVLGSTPALETPYEADVRFAIGEIGKQCKTLLEVKGIDWKKVRGEFTKSAKDVEDDTQHLVLLTRLLARLEDGHAEIEPGASDGKLPWPEEWMQERVGPGFFLCRVGKKLYVKSAWSSAAEVGLAPGMELVSVDGQNASKWFEADDSN
jgi:hypothetical protein